MGSISISSYSTILMQLVRSPGRFFGNRGDELQGKQAILFLLVSSMLFTAASLLVLQCDNALISAMILFVNAFGMALVLSIIGYAVMGFSLGRKSTFGLFFSVYAYASGAVLLAAWIPSMVVFTEPWRWILIGIGLRYACGLSIYSAAWVIFCSITIATLLLWSIMPH